MTKNRTKEEIQEIKELYKYYHYRYWCYQNAYTHYKKVNLAPNIVSAGLVIIGSVAGGITANPIIIGTVTGAGVLDFCPLVTKFEKQYGKKFLSTPTTSSN